MVKDFKYVQADGYQWTKESDLPDHEVIDPAVLRITIEPGKGITYATSIAGVYRKTGGIMFLCLARYLNTDLIIFKVFLIFVLFRALSMWLSGTFVAGCHIADYARWVKGKPCPWNEQKATNDFGGRHFKRS